MSDIINLLPDSVANQIAAGEVVQRPASAVKELLENAVDAGAAQIKLLVKDAGKSLISVVDDGCGMSPVDARMCFERHATSKINRADDLFRIQTMGFRGEALASIAAIAHVELKTKPHDAEVGTHIIVEGSKVIAQNEIATPAGTSFTVKNLFFNTPARRNFLKSNPVELRHITAEFYRVALIHPHIAFSFIDGNRERFALRPENMKQRIVSLFGKNLNARLLDVSEKTSVVNIEGFVGKPEVAKKVRGEQYFFVNKRFIKHPYLNHAVMQAYDELIPEGSFPSYFIHLTVDPENIDVNIHPTKTEVNFKDEKAIYSILRAAVKMALGKYALSPRIDFDVEQSMDLNPLPPGTEVKPPEIKYNPDYNPFTNPTPGRSAGKSYTPPYEDDRSKNNRKHWQQLYDVSVHNHPDDEAKDSFFDDLQWMEKVKELDYFSVGHRFLVGLMEQGLVLIDRQAAHERVLFDSFAAHSADEDGWMQKKIFPDVVSLSAPDADLLRDILPEMYSLGFDIKHLKDNEFEVHATPPDLADELLTPIIEGMLDHYKLNQMELKIDKRENILLAMAKNLSVAPGRPLSREEVQGLVKALFQTAMPARSPSGKTIMVLLPPERLSKLLNEQ